MITSFNNNSAVLGGAVYIEGSNSSIVGSDFSLNNATKKGGAVYIASENDKLENSTFDANHAIEGGAVYVGGYNSKINNLTFTNNTASNEGGAIYTSAEDTEIDNSKFIENHADVHAGAIFSANKNTTIVNSEFELNTANQWAGAIFTRSENATVKNSTFTKNHADVDGGAIYTQGFNTNVLDSKFYNNTASNDGGAVYVYQTDALIKNSTFVENHADVDGGAVFSTSEYTVVDNSTFIKNDANHDAGAIYLRNSDALINNSKFINNTADFGGAISTDSYNETIANSTFIDNEAAIYGGAIYLGGVNSTVTNSNFTNNNGTLMGGAIFVNAENNTITNSSFNDNYAVSGGAIAIAKENVLVTNSTFDNNTAVEGAGAIYSGGNNNVISNSNFTNNRATATDPSLGNGGAVYLAGLNATVKNSTFVNNTAHNNGGAVFSTSEDGKIINSTFEFNKATVGTGGAIYTDKDKNQLITNSTFTNNTAGWTGGAIHTDSYNLTISNCNFTNNTVPRNNGGAVYVAGNAQNGRIENSNFISNSAVDLAGAVYIQPNNFNITGSNFTNNTCKNIAGALYWAGQNGNLANSSFINNHADIAAGALNVGGNDLNITNVNFTDNTAQNTGGAILVGGNNANITNATFKGNNATRGSAIYLGGNDLSIANAEFKPNQAHASSLEITVKNPSYWPSDVNVTVTFRGQDNIANAIWNEKDVSNILLSNITYEFFTNGVLTTKNTGVGYVNPQDGAGNSNKGALIYQDNREDAQKLNVLIKNKEDNTVILNLTGNYTDIYGNITSILKRLKPGNYTVKAEHLSDDYYTEILSDSEFEVKEILNITKTPQVNESNVGELVNYTIVIKNNGDVDLSNVTVIEHIPDGFIIVDWTRTWNKTGNVFKYNYTLAAQGEITLVITFNTTKNGTYLNNISVSTNETLNITVNATDNLTVYRPNMTVNKTCNVTNAYPYDLINYTITVKNTGDRVLPNVTVTDNIPNGFILKSFSEDLWEKVSDNVFRLKGDLAINQTVKLNLVFNATLSGDFINSVILNSTHTSNITNESGNVHIYTINLTVVKIANRTEMDVGELINYTVIITNTGEGNLTDIKFNDTFPDGFKFVRFEGTNWTNSSNVFSYNGILKSGDNATIVLIFNATLNGTFTNHVNVSSNRLSNVTNSSNETRVYLPNMTVIKVANVTFVDVGQNLNFTVTVTNTGDRNLTQIKVREIFPDAFELVDFSHNDWSYNATTKTFSYNGNLTVGDSLVLNITFKAINNGTFNNTVVVSSNGTPEITNSSQNVTVYRPNMTVVKVANVTQLDVGQNVNFTVTVTNTGDRNLTQVKVREVFQDNLELIGFSEGWSYNTTTKTFTYGGVLGLKDPAVLNITFRAVKNGTFNNTVVVSSNGTPDVINSSENITVYRPNMTVVKVANITKLDVGENVNFTVTVTNTGDRNLTQVKVREVFPDNLELIGFTEGWSYNATTKTFSYNGNLTVKQSLVLNITFKAVRNGTFNNTVVVSSNGTPDVINSSENITVYRPNMTVVKVANITKLDVGENVNFTVTITNTGDRNLTNIVLKDIFSEDSFTRVDYTRTWIYDGVLKTYNYTGTLEVGKSIIFNITFKAINNGTFNNTVVVSSNGTPEITNSSQNVTVYRPNMTVVKVANVTEIDVGQNITFTVNITNTGDRNLTLIKFSEVFPDAFEYISHDDSNWTYNGTTKVFSYNGNLTVKNSLILNIIFKAVKNGTFNNTVVVSSNGTPEITNSSQNVTVYRPNMTVVKVANITKLDVGQNVNFTVTITNTGDRNLTQVKVREVFPDNLELIGFSEGWSYNATTKTFTYGGVLGLNDPLVLNITFKAVKNGTFNNTVVVSSNGTPEVTNSSENVTVYRPNMTVVKVANITKLDVGENVNFTVTITNTGDRNLTLIKVREVFPDNLELIGFSEGWSYNATTKVFSYNGNLTVKQSLVLNITFKAVKNGTFNNTVVVSSNGTPEITNSSQNITVYRPNMTVVKVANVTELEVGQNVNFTVTITNTGDRNLTQVKVLEIFPDNLELIAFSEGWSYNATTKTFSYYGDLTVKHSLVLNITFKAVNNGTFNNTVVVSSNGTPEVTNSSENLTVYRSNMTVNKTVNVTEIDVGNLVKYNITIKNTGDSNLTNISVYESDLRGFILVSYNNEDGWDNSSGIFKYNHLLTPGSIINLILVYNATENGTFINRVNVSSNRTGNITNESSEVKVYRPNMTVVKVANITQLDVGQNVNFTVTITNTGDKNLTNITLKDVFSQNDFELVDYTRTWIYDEVLKTYNYTGILEVKKSITFNITFKALNNGTFNNTVVVKSNSTSEITNSSQNVTVSRPNMTVVKVANITTLNVGENITFTVNITNTGDRNLTLIKFREIFPDAFEYVIHDDTNWTYNKTTKVFEYRGTLAVKDSLVLNIIFNTVKNGTFNNTVVVTSNGTPEITNSSDNVTVYMPNMTITKTANVTEVNLNHYVNYTITITNTGDCPLLNITVDESIPDGFIITDYTDSWKLNGKIFSYNKTLDAGETIVLNITFKVTKGGNYTNTIVVKSNRTPNETVKSNNTVKVFAPNLIVKETTTTPVVYVRDGVVFVVNVTNNGDENLSDVYVLEFKDPTLVYDSFKNITGNWSVDIIDDILLFTLNEKLNIGESRSFEIHYNSTKAGTVTSSVEAGNGEDLFDDDTADAVVLKVKTHTSINNVTGKPGDELTFNINVTAEDNIPFNGNVTLKLPDGTTKKVEIINGSGKTTWTVPKGYGGSYNTYVTYDGDERYIESDAEGTVKIQVPTKITVGNVTGKPGEEVTIPITVDTDDGSPFNGNITVVLPDGTKKTVEIINGHGSVKWLIPKNYKGNYNVYAYFEGNEIYLASNGTGIVSVIVDSDKNASKANPENNTHNVGKALSNPEGHVTGNPLVVLLISLAGVIVLRRKNKI